MEKTAKELEEIYKAQTPVGRWLGWRERIQADLDAQVEAGATLYGINKDGVWTARDKNGVREIDPPKRKSS